MASWWPTTTRFSSSPGVSSADALVHDVYAECLVPSTRPVMDLERVFAFGCCCYHSLATRFIDDKLLRLMNEWDELRQIVLLTDGMDTRPYRISRPRSAQIFDISLDQVYMIASERLTRKDHSGHGAKVTRGCMLSHIPLHAPDIGKVLVERGYTGSRPTICVLQMFVMGGKKLFVPDVFSNY